jgi:hypothetical protein
VRKLGPTQTLVLLALEARPEDEAPPTPFEIAETVARLMDKYAGHRRPTSEAEAVNASLRTLERRGFVRKLGKSWTGGRCWEITDDGIAALKQEADQ